MFSVLLGGQNGWFKLDLPCDGELVCATFEVLVSRP